MAQVAPTPRDTLWRDGSASLYRFRRPSSVKPAGALPVLVVPSMIDKWYVVDLRTGASLVEALVAGGLDVYCLDWGTAQDEDRYLTWDDVLARLGRAVRFTERHAGRKQVGLLGYCMGATLAGIYAALEPKHVAALINLAGPFDFAHGGLLRTMVDPKWFDASAVASAGNVSADQMQSGFVALRPSAQMAKWIGYLDRMHEPASRESFGALEEWSGDNIPFPGSAYETYIGDLYQNNALVKGEHHVAGRRVDLGSIRCPVLTVAAERDTICPLAAARALNETCGSADKELVVVPGGHVGAVVGSRAPKVLYPAMRDWLRAKLAATAKSDVSEVNEVMQLKDVKAIVTGAGRGMGAHFARRLLEAGAQVAAGDIDEAALSELPAGIHKRKLDVRRESDCVEFTAWARDAMGGLNSLVNNAGIIRDGLLVRRDKTTGEIKKMTSEDWRAVLDVNLSGATFMVRETVALMLQTETRPGVVVNMSSIPRLGNKGQSNYVATKAALAANTVTWSREFASYGVRVVAVAPGMIETPMTQGMHQKARDALVAAIPVGRIGVPEDIWLAVKFAIECDYVNGRTIEVDGGLTMA